MKTALLTDNIVEAEAASNIGSSVKESMERNRRYLFELAVEALVLSDKYALKPKASVFDFRDHDYFCLWAIDNGNEKRLIKGEVYRSKISKMGVGGLLQAAKHGWFGKTVDRDVFKEEVSKMFSGLYRGEVNSFLKSPHGKIFGYDDSKEKIHIEYIPKGILL